MIRGVSIDKNASRVAWTFSRIVERGLVGKLYLLLATRAVYSIIRIPMIIPGSNPPIKSLAMETSAMTAYTTMVVLGE
jgi:hypothetical protein